MPSMMTFVRSLVLVAVVGAFGACQQQPVEVIKSIEETMHHHKHDAGHGDHGDHAKDSHGTTEDHPKKTEESH